MAQDNEGSSNDAQQQGPQDGDGAGPSGSTGAAPQLMSSFFPSPPSTYAQYTPQNLALAKRLVAYPSYQADVDDWQGQQERILVDELKVEQSVVDAVRDVNLRWLVTPPDAALIEADGHWMAYGQAWPINEVLPSLEEMGVKQLFETPKTFEDRRRALHSLLRTVLHTYLRLLSVLLQGPPSIPSEQAHFKADPSQLLTTQADQLIEHLKLASINIHHICNEWRPVQAREMVKLVLRNQIDERKAKISEIRSACQGITERLQALNTRVDLDEAKADEAAESMQTITLDTQPPSSSTLKDSQSQALEEQSPSQAMLQVDQIKADAKRRLRAALEAIGD